MNSPIQFYSHPIHSLKIKVEDSKVEIWDTRNNKQFVDSFFIEVEKMKIEKLNTTRFLAECVIGRRLKKHEAIAFRDGNETNFNINNFQIITLLQENNTIYIAINLDENDKSTEYKSIQSISRALGVRGAVINSYFEGIVDKVRSPKTNNFYRFEKKTTNV